MAATLGMDFVLYFDKGTLGIEDWVMIAGQRNATLNQSTETHDIGVKGANGWKDYIAGAREWSIDCDGLYYLDDDAFTAFNDAYLARKKLKVEVRLPNDKRYEGLVLIENLDLDMNYDDTVTYGTTLKGCGELQLVDVPPIP
ncbi:phage tail tube protein [Sporosarcina beigongshangi]|uniref:phage tail tube protein n=1 Tax=Sporosarcina beigongshangi TaxID=2782538 RepID=UPI00193ADF16|nr:phage tail tube protein [Sporosarcina beigongshangi]